MWPAGSRAGSADAGPRRRFSSNVPWSWEEAYAGVPGRVLLSLQSPSYERAIVEQATECLYHIFHLQGADRSCGNLRGE